MNNSNLQQIKNLMYQVKNAANSQLAIQSVIANNPGLQNFVSLANNKGISLEQIARMLAQQKGVDINDLIQQLNT